MAGHIPVQRPRRTRSRLRTGPATKRRESPVLPLAAGAGVGVLVVLAAVLQPLMNYRTFGHALVSFLDFFVGVFTLLALTATVVGGLLAAYRSFLTPKQRVLAQQAHRATAVAALGCLVVHILVKVGEGHIPLLAALIPFADGTGLAVGLGIAAAYLMALAAITGAVRGRFAGGPRPGSWRVLHATAYVCWAFGLAHGLTAGRPGKGFVFWGYGICAALVLLVLVARVLARLIGADSRRRGRTGLRAYEPGAVGLDALDALVGLSVPEPGREWERKTPAPPAASPNATPPARPAGPPPVVVPQRTAYDPGPNPVATPRHAPSCAAPSHATPSCATSSYAAAFDAGGQSPRQHPFPDARFGVVQDRLFDTGQVPVVARSAVPQDPAAFAAGQSAASRLAQDTGQFGAIPRQVADTGPFGGVQQTFLDTGQFTAVRPVGHDGGAASQVAHGTGTYGTGAYGSGAYGAGTYGAGTHATGTYAAGGPGTGSYSGRLAPDAYASGQHGPAGSGAAPYRTWDWVAGAVGDTGTIAAVPGTQRPRTGR